MLQVRYTLGQNITDNQYHLPIICAQLTCSLLQLVLEVIDEIQSAFLEVILPMDGEGFRKVDIQFI